MIGDHSFFTLFICDERFPRYSYNAILSMDVGPEGLQVKMAHEGKYEPMENKRRLALVGEEQLLEEGLRVILSQVADLELVGPWEIKPDTLALVAEVRPDVILIADPDLDCAAAKALTAQILEMFPDVPVIRIALSHAYMRVFTTRTVPAGSQELIQAIHGLPLGKPPANE